MLGGRGWMLLAVIAACGPSSPAIVDDESGSSSEGASGTGSDSSSSSTTVATDEVQSSGSSSSTGPVLDCAAYEKDCPDDCQSATAYADGDWECIDQSEPRIVCTERGPPVLPDYASAWWKEIDGQPFVLMVGHACPEQVEYAPLDWSECTGSIDEPSACRCLCHRGTCDGENDIATARSCGEPMVCPPASGWLKGGTDPEMLCVLEAWRDRVPGIYEVAFYGPNDGTTFRLLVAPDGAVQVTRYMLYLTGCPSPLNGLWRPAQRCQLADAEFFSACAMPDTPIRDCEASDTTLDPWIANCVDEPFVCE